MVEAPNPALRRLAAIQETCAVAWPGEGRTVQRLSASLPRSVRRESRAAAPAFARAVTSSTTSLRVAVSADGDAAVVDVGVGIALGSKDTSASCAPPRSSLHVRRGHAMLRYRTELVKSVGRWIQIWR